MLALFGLLFLLFRLIVYLYFTYKFVFWGIAVTVLGLTIWAIVEMSISCRNWEKGLTGELNYDT